MTDKYVRAEYAFFRNGSVYLSSDKFPEEGEPLYIKSKECAEPASVEPVTMPYLLRKGGMWYAHNSSGYTARAELAELYTKNYADTHASHHDDVSAIPLNEIISSSKQLDPFIERMRKMQEALECAAKPLPPGEE